MRQIIPFKKELLFKTKICEITSISLEHTLRLKSSSLVSGEFHINGDYKMTEASINREKFYFTLPFEIDLGEEYDNNINIDIDNFYYEVVNDEVLQVNIDVFIDGDKIVNLETGDLDYEEKRLQEVDIDLKENNSDIDESVINDVSEYEKNISDDKDNFEFFDSSVEYKKNISDELEIEKEFFCDNIGSDIDLGNNVINVNNKSNNINIFDNDSFSDDTYATYYVYVVKEDDNIDKILEKFSTTKEELLNYNDLENVKKGTKLIIPSKNE